MTVPRDEIFDRFILCLAALMFVIACSILSGCKPERPNARDLPLSVYDVRCHNGSNGCWSVEPQLPRETP